MDAAVAQALDRLAPAFRLSAAALRALADRFGEELARGLAGEPSSLRMLPTFARQPRGDERARVIVVDWGGTNGRVALIELRAQGRFAVDGEESFTFTDAEKVAPAAEVFDAIAAAIEQVVAGDRRTAFPLGLIYSFPARLERIDRAIALPLTKGWRPTGLEGADVVELLTAALRRHRLPNVVVRAVANDTVAPMVLQTYRARAADPDARPAEIGLILGTGTNQAADLPGAGIRNLECGNFDGVVAVETPYDAALDRALADPAPGAQRLEKMVSGHYLGEIVRRIVCDLAARGPAFAWFTAPAFRDPFGFESEHLSLIEADRSPTLEATAALLGQLGVSSSLEERRALRTVARLVAARSARLTAAGLVATLRRIDPALHARHTVAVDGSLYGGYPGYGDMVVAGLVDLAGAAAGRIELEFIKDSTGAGAAVITAVAAGKAETPPHLAPPHPKEGDA
ncbi:MAG: hypothetical protein L0027_07380 [Candidatus Rokubacteria bacterium]|nr:hypothetical protein [Candidatus Rokubacteria bacterium]